MKLKTFRHTLGNTFRQSLTSSHYSRRLSNSGNYSSKWEELREERLKMDNYTCQKCGFDGHKHKNMLHVHHKVPLSRGGRNKLANLITLCKECHKKIHDKHSHKHIRGHIK